MKKLYYLKTCSTCQRINKSLNLTGVELKNIKEEKMSTEELEEMRKLAGSYNALFSRTAMKYKSLGLKDRTLSEEELKNYILDEYTFLKRPVFIIEDKIFIGSKANVVEELKKILN
jgi:arsenate reductase (glutaredoxin)